MAAPSPAALQALSAAVLNPPLWKLLLAASQPIRLAIAANLWLGRSLRSLAAEVLHRLATLAGWLAGKIDARRLRRFSREYFTPRRWHAVLAAAALGKAMHWLAGRWVEHASGRRQLRKDLQRRMHDATSYAEWAEAAVQLETVSGMTPQAAWELETRLYDRRLLQERLAYLRRVRAGGDVVDVMFALRADLLRNLGNMANSELHRHFPVVPEPIRDYIEEAQAHLRLITNAPELPVDEKLAFLRETRHAFGRTALVLSGGGSFGSFHVGVVKALHDAGLLPRVVSGSSAGAIVAALLATRTDAELSDLYSTMPAMDGIDFYSSNTLRQIVRHLLLKGTLQDHRVLQERLRRLLGDMTFAEAYQRSGRIVNIAVTAADTSEPPRLLNYLTAPHVLVWSAVACSSAFPLLFAPQQLLARDAKGGVVGYAQLQAATEMQRRWRDGSLEEDLPMRGLSEMFNCNYYLVSQCNPYLLPIIALKRLAPGKLGVLVEGEFKHRCKQLMDALPAWAAGSSSLLKLLNQPWEGDVTMVLPVTTLSTAKSVINLSPQDVTVAMQEGRRAAWAKLSAIQANCAIEATIDDCLRQVTAAARAARGARRAKPPRGADKAAAAGPMQGPMRRGLPSWVNMELGIEHVDSSDALTPATSYEARAATPLATARLGLLGHPGGCG